MYDDCKHDMYIAIVLEESMQSFLALTFVFLPAFIPRTHTHIHGSLTYSFTHSLTHGLRHAFVCCKSKRLVRSEATLLDTQQHTKASNLHFRPKSRPSLNAVRRLSFSCMARRHFDLYQPFRTRLFPCMSCHEATQLMPPPPRSKESLKKKSRHDNIGSQPPTPPSVRRTRSMEKH